MVPTSLRLSVPSAGGDRAHRVPTHLGRVSSVLRGSPRRASTSSTRASPRRSRSHAATARWRPRAQRLGLDPGDLVVLHVGSNEPRKNVATVCRVVARLCAWSVRPVWLLKIGGPLGDAELDVPPSGRPRPGAAGEPRVHAGAGADLSRRNGRSCTRRSTRASAGRSSRRWRAVFRSWHRRQGRSRRSRRAAALFDPGDVDGMATRVAEIAMSHASANGRRPRDGGAMAASPGRLTARPWPMRTARLRSR